MVQEIDYVADTNNLMLVITGVDPPHSSQVMACTHELLWASENLIPARTSVGMVNRRPAGYRQVEAATPFQAPHHRLAA